jgi:hypothetical protein
VTRLDAEINFRLFAQDKQLLFAVEKREGTTVAAVLRGFVEVFVTNPRWAEALRDAGVPAPSERIPVQGR